MFPSALLFLPGCNRIARFFYLSSYDRDISSATKSIETARDNAQRAEAYAKRGSAYSEKARYSKAFKLISADEYDRLFGLAIKDHDQAIALDPSAEAYYTRGVTHYDRANLEAVVDGRSVGSDADRKAWFDPFPAALVRLYSGSQAEGNLSAPTLGKIATQITVCIRFPAFRGPNTLVGR
ncbi:MAG: hypothetical protein WB566_02940 [Terriglobales bacterium]